MNTNLKPGNSSTKLQNTKLVQITLLLPNQMNQIPQLSFLPDCVNKFNDFILAEDITELNKVPAKVF